MVAVVDAEVELKAGATIPCQERVTMATNGGLADLDDNPKAKNTGDTDTHADALLPRLLPASPAHRPRPDGDITTSATRSSKPCAVDEQGLAEPDGVGCAVSRACTTAHPCYTTTARRRTVSVVLSSPTKHNWLGESCIAT